MRKSKKFPSINTWLLLLGVPAVCTLRTIAIIKDYNNSSGYFGSEKLINAAGWVLFALCALTCIEALFNVKRKNLTPDFETAETYIPAGLCSAGCMFMAGYLFSICIEEIKFPEAAILIIIPLLATFFALASTVGFVVFIVCSDRKSAPRALATMGISVFLLLVAAYIYFNRDLPLNAPNKIVDLAAYIFASIFFLYETRISLGSEKWGLYSCFGGIAAILCAYSAIPSIIAYFARGYIVSTDILENVLTLLLFSFIGARVLLTNRLTKDGACELVMHLSQEARERDEHIETADRNFSELMAVLNAEEAGASPEDEDTDQISISDILDESSAADLDEPPLLGE